MARPFDETAFQKRKMQILEAAIQEFAEKGYRGASMRSIAGAAQISASVLYHYFTSKKAILEAIFEEEALYKEGQIAEARSLPGTPEDLLFYWAEAYLRSASNFNNLDLFKIMFGEALRQPQIARRYTEQYLVRLEEAMAAILAEKSGGLSREKTQIAVSMVMDVVFGYIVQRRILAGTSENADRHFLASLRQVINALFKEETTGTFGK